MYRLSYDDDDNNNKKNKKNKNSIATTTTTTTKATTKTATSSSTSSSWGQVALTLPSTMIILEIHQSMSGRYIYIYSYIFKIWVTPMQTYSIFTNVYIYIYIYVWILHECKHTFKTWWRGSVIQSCKYTAWDRLDLAMFSFVSGPCHCALRMQTPLHWDRELLEVRHFGGGKSDNCIHWEGWNHRRPWSAKPAPRGHRSTTQAARKYND